MIRKLTKIPVILILVLLQISLSGQDPEANIGITGIGLFSGMTWACAILASTIRKIKIPGRMVVY